MESYSQLDKEADLLLSEHFLHCEEELAMIDEIMDFQMGLPLEIEEEKKEECLVPLWELEEEKELDKLSLYSFTGQELNYMRERERMDWADYLMDCFGQDYPDATNDELAQMAIEYMGQHTQ